MSRVFRLVSIVSLFALLFAAPVGAAGPFDDGEEPLVGADSDSPSHPLGDEQAALRAQALEAQVQGKANGKVHEVARGQYVELTRENLDRIFVVIAEFGDGIHPAYNGTPGPRHNQITEPNRATDNSTIWQADFDRAHYEDMYFNRMARYYESQSSGRYSVEGAVMEWVRVPFNEARYGRDLCGSIVCSNTWFLLRDANNIWVADRLAEGWTLQQITDYLKTFDVQDRYDADGDGNFVEPDGYIDHFQIVHAGEGQETGGGAQGADAIWSHRWYTAYQGIGAWGPPGAPFGGMEFGGAGTYAQLGGPNAAGVWVGDYTIQPENGGLGVFAHEFGHDLGLPDLYDTAGNTCGSACENSTGFWTLMSSGSYLGDGSTDGIGTTPGDLGAWEKFQLGWLNYEVAYAGQKSVHKLGPAETNTKQAQGLFVVLPDKAVTVNIGAPYSGQYFYYSGAGDDLDQSMYRSFSLPTGASLSAQVRYQIELDWDYAYLIVSTDGGATWTNVDTNLSSHTSPNGQNFGNGITGASGGNWVTLTADLSAYSGAVLLGFRYWTDGAVVEPGFMVDDLAVSGAALDDAESNFGWTFDGFRVTSGTETGFFFNAYLAESRQYRGYDAGLQTGPYNFGFLNTAPDWVEHFPYQDGLLISYWDTSQTDNSTSVHPGAGLILPIDAHPTTMFRADGNPWRARIQSYDSTFSLEPTDGITLHVNGNPSVHPSQAGVSVFDDRNQYWNSQTPTAGVINPNTGTIIEIQSVSAQGNFMQVQVRPAK